MFKQQPERATSRALWRGVIARTIQDWLSKPLRPQREAERYLFQNSADLTLVCALAEICVLKMRTCLDRVRGRSLEYVLAAGGDDDVAGIAEIVGVAA